jgi:hypothetical protein
MGLAMWQRKAHVGQDRRGDFRTMCTGATVIDVLSPQPRSAVPARVLDVGTTGLMLGVPYALAPGAIIRIRMTDGVADAEVRYCTSQGSEFHIGVKVEEISTAPAEVDESEVPVAGSGAAEPR